MRARLRSVNQAKPDNTQVTRVFVELEILNPNEDTVRGMKRRLGGEVAIEHHEQGEVVNILGHEFTHNPSGCPQCNLEAR